MLYNTFFFILFTEFMKVLMTVRNCVGVSRQEGCCNTNCQEMSKLPKDEQRKIRKARKRPSLTSFKKSIRPQENIAERNINSR